jgi:hypothetical protein
VDPFGNDRQDIVLIKVDMDGNLVWQRNYVGNYVELGYCVQETRDNGFIIAGLEGLNPSMDIWLIKTDSSGIVEWERTFDSGDHDEAHAVEQTYDGGYIVVGFRRQLSTVDEDVYLIKTDSLGNKQWHQFLGSSERDVGYDIQQTPDYGYIIAGMTNTNSAGLWDAMLLKTDNTGQEQWTRTYGGQNVDSGHKVQRTFDGGYMIFGYTDSFDAGNGNGDMWVVKTDSTGTEEWNQTLGDSGRQVGYAGQLCQDGGCIVAGLTESAGAGMEDFWLVKIGSNETEYMGCLRSSNLIESQYTLSIDSFDITIFEPAGSSIAIQFSNDFVRWFNSDGMRNWWDVLINGANSIDLSSLGWSGAVFHYRCILLSDTTSMPAVSKINLHYSQYYTSGTLESQALDFGEKVAFKKLSWDAVTFPGMEVKLQLKTAETQARLPSTSFLGPDGGTASYYSTQNAPVWSGNAVNRWLQYKIYLVRVANSNTPVFTKLTLTYNILPEAPVLTGPADDAVLNTVEPEFTWDFTDSDSSRQEGFQWQADDDSTFSSVDYDSGEVSSSFSYYLHTTELAEGTWYWRVRTQDSEGDWGSFSDYSEFTIDVSIEPPTEVTVIPVYWSSKHIFTVDWNEPVDTSGFETGAFYYIGPDPPSYEYQGTWRSEKPISISNSVEGDNFLYLWLKDKAGNSDLTKYSSAPIKLDSTPPTITHSTVKTTTGNEEIKLTAEVWDESSGTDEVKLLYKHKSDSDYTELAMVKGPGSGIIYTVTIPEEFVKDENIQYYIKATDNSTPKNTHYFGINGQTIIEPRIIDFIEIALMPKVVEMTPSGINQTLDSKIRIKFNKDMKEKTVEEAFSIEPSVLGTYSWNDNEFIFTPNYPFNLKTQYVVRLSSDSTCFNGYNLDKDYQWSFTTIEDPAGTAGPGGSKPTGSEEDEKTERVNMGLVVAIIMVVLIIIIAGTVGLYLSRRKKEKEEEEGEDARKASSTEDEFGEEIPYRRAGSVNEEEAASNVTANQVDDDQKPMYVDYSSSGHDTASSFRRAPVSHPARPAHQVQYLPPPPRGPPQMPLHQPRMQPPPAQVQQAGYYRPPQVPGPQFAAAPYRCMKCGSGIMQPNSCPRCGWFRQ